mgnify:CR=1 FL=1
MRKNEAEKKLSQANKALVLILIFISLAGFYQLRLLLKPKTKIIAPEFVEVVKDQKGYLVRVEDIEKANQIDRYCPEIFISPLDQLIILKENCQVFKQGASNFARLLSGEKMLINQADAKELKIISGVGNKRAEMILELRAKLGGFSQLEELRKFHWVNDKMMNEFKRYFKIEDKS